jgi:hypothetical protein
MFGHSHESGQGHRRGKKRSKQYFCTTFAITIMYTYNVLGMSNVPIFVLWWWVNQNGSFFSFFFFFNLKFFSTPTFITQPWQLTCIRVLKADDSWGSKERYFYILISLWECQQSFRHKGWLQYMHTMSLWL